MLEDHFLRGNTLFVTTWCEFRLLSSFASMDQNRNDDQLPINTIIAILFCANPLLHPQKEDPEEHERWHGVLRGRDRQELLQDTEVQWVEQRRGGG